MSQIAANTRVLEDNDEALIAGGEAQVLGDGEEFVDLTKDQPKDEPAQEPVAKTPPATPAAATTPPADDDIPQEYRGKSLKDIIQMHKEAQQAIGRQGSELGELRRVVDTHIRAQRPAAKPTAKPTPTPIEDSQVFAKPIETISQLIEQHPLIQELRQTMGQTAAETAQRRMESSKARFDAAHPDAGEILKDQAFREWVQASPKRREMLLDANNKYDFAAGDEVFSTWKALKGRAQPAATAPAAAAATPAAAAPGQPTEAEVSAAAAVLARARTAKAAAGQAAAQAAAAPTGGASAGKQQGGKKYYRRADVIRLMSEDPDRYEQMEPEIRKAYVEGRVR